MEKGFCVVESKKKTEIKAETEETYLLSDILSNGGCIRCMNKTCKINGIHGMPFSEDFPDVKAKYILDTFSKFVLNLSSSYSLLFNLMVHFSFELFKFLQSLTFKRQYFWFA